MPDLFEEEYALAKKLSGITDELGSRVFERVRNGPPEAAPESFQRADRGRLGTPMEQHDAAYTYLGLAFLLLKHDGLTIPSGGKNLGPDMLFHFAGHAFREIGQLNRAADAYRRAGVVSTRGKTPKEFGIRSLARAKMCYEEIGESERSDQMHCLEWEARRLGSLGFRRLFLWLWAVTSRYGTDVRQWAKMFARVVLVSALVYECMHSLGWIYGQEHWTPIVSSLYCSVVTMTTLGYGDFVPHHWVAQLFVILNVFAGYFLLAVGATILGKKVIGR
jgi:hypothetical protein